MAYVKPRSMDGFAAMLTCSGDTRIRQILGSDLVTYLSDPDNTIECEDIGAFIDALVVWMQSSNFKVSQSGLEAMALICDRLRHDFWPYVSTVLPPVIDRLGDQRDSVREKAQELILKLLERQVMQPQQLLDKLSEGFSHKNSKIREEVLRCLVSILQEHGAQHIALNKLVPNISKLLCDPIPSVREAAFNTLAEVYRHVGDKLRADLQKRNCIPSTKLPQLLAKFNDIKANGELLPSAVCNDVVDEPDRVMKSIKPLKRNVSATSAVKRTPSISAGPAGAVDEASFIKSFEDVPSIQIFSSRDVAEHIKDVIDTLSDTTKMWTKRVDGLKKIRSLLMNGFGTQEEFIQNLRQLEAPLEIAVGDLRSQVVREACATIAFMSQVLGNKFDVVTRVLLPGVINLLQNSAKVIATAGLLCLRHVLTYTQVPKMIPVVAHNATTSKSREIRKTCYTLVNLILRTWPTHALERQLPVLVDTIKKGIADADSDARQTSRKSFWAFKEHFPDAAELLMKSLEPNYQRAVRSMASGEHMSSSSSSSSLNQVSTGPTAGRSATSSADASPGRVGMRSYTAIDLQAAQRAKARTQYAAMARQKIASGTASLPRPKKSTKSNASNFTPEGTPEHTGRTRSRPVGGSISQPTSRSVSPSLRMSYATYGRQETETRPRKLSSGIPRSTSASRDHSRETSPTRTRTLGGYRNSPSSMRGHRPPISPHRPPVMAQKILQQSREAESALAAALSTEDSPDFGKTSTARRLNRSLDNPSDESEASSVCSDRSFDSCRRPSDSYSLSGSHTRLSREHWEHISRDINDIIDLCASRTWTERKEGLLGLYSYLNDGNMLEPSQLRHITELFHKMFMDPNTKVVSLFLDTLNELIVTHAHDLHDWLYMLLQRIFIKLNGETLPSFYKKIEKTLEVIRENFPPLLQLHNVFRYLTDVTQTPNVKVKVSVLVYIIHLTSMSDSFVSDNASQVSQAVDKIISMLDDKRSTEIQNTSRNCLIALFNCNAPQFTMLLSTLPTDRQQVAADVIESLQLRSRRLSNSGSPLKDGLSREDVHRSLRHTTAEIQNYSYEKNTGGLISPTALRGSPTRESIPGVFNNSPPKMGMSALDARMAQLRINTYQRHGGSNNTNGGPASLPPNTHIGNGDVCNSLEDSNLSESDVVKKVTEFETGQYSESDKVALLVQMAALIKNNETAYAVENFRPLLRNLLDNLETSSDPVQAAVLKVLVEMFRNDDVRASVLMFLELLVIRILQAHVSSGKTVTRNAEQAAASMIKFPLEGVANVLTPVIATENVPAKIESAIKMLTKVIEANDATQLTDKLLNTIVPQLIVAYDHQDSTVRKSAVFCMVAIHRVVGEDSFNPYIGKLSGSKLRLLRLYIQRAQQRTPSTPTSPKNNANNAATHSLT